MQTQTQNSYISTPSSINIITTNIPLNEVCRRLLEGKLSDGTEVRMGEADEVPVEEERV